MHGCACYFRRAVTSGDRKRRWDWRGVQSKLQRYRWYFSLKKKKRSKANMAHIKIHEICLIYTYSIFYVILYFSICLKKRKLKYWRQGYKIYFCLDHDLLSLTILQILRGRVWFWPLVHYLTCPVFSFHQRHQDYYASHRVCGRRMSPNYSGNHSLSKAEGVYFLKLHAQGGSCSQQLLLQVLSLWVRKYDREWRELWIIEF